jgi:hypothetical protein
VKYILIDLPDACLLTSYYLSHAFPEKSLLLYSDLKSDVVTAQDIADHDIIIMPPWVDYEKSVGFDCFINSRSFMEMNYKVIEHYFEMIQSRINPGGILLNINRYHKSTVGEPIMLHRYPYDEYWNAELSKRLEFQDHIHLLLTRRTSRPGNIKQALIEVEEAGKAHIPKKYHRETT